MADGVIGWDAVLEGHLAAEQCKVLASARIGMAGAGGLGSNCAVFLARTGIRDFVIADPDVVKQYLRLCRPDSLAIGIGNAHGFYNGPVDIRVEVLEECRKFTDIPFVLHGCTGMDEELVKRSIDSGVAKINFGTQVRCRYVEYLKEGLAEGKDQGHAWKLSQYAELRLREDIKDIIRLAGSQDKA